MMLNYISEIWLSLAIIMMAVEVLFGGTIVLLFSGISCFIVGFLISSDLLDANNITLQLTIFFITSFISTLILWRPLKKILHSKSNQYVNIIGQSGVVIENDLHKNLIGKIRWSGTIVNVLIDNFHEENHFKIGTHVTIVAVKENIFIVR